MKKIFLLLSLFCFSNTFAQTESAMSLSLNRMSSADEIIETSMKSALVVLHQSYRVKDSKGQEYNRKGKDCFNEVLSVGLMLQGGIYVSQEVLFPWKNDEKFAQYEKSYTPFPHETYAYPFCSDTKERTLVENVSFDTLIPNRSYFAKTEVFKGQGLEIDAAKGEKKGYMVWVVSNDSTGFDSLYLLVEPAAYKFGNDCFYPIEEPVVKGIQALFLQQAKFYAKGGFYIVPDYSTVGSVVFKLSAVAVPADNGWWLSPVFMSQCSHSARLLKAEEDKLEAVPEEVKSRCADKVKKQPKEKSKKTENEMETVPTAKNENQNEQGKDEVESASVKK